MIYIYILKLKSNKYYIGKTSNPKFRLDSHFNYNGSAWTNKYKPINIHQLIPGCDNFDEDKYTLKYMEKYGINNVRGGSFCQLKLSNENKKTIEKMIMSTSDKCYKCGQKGHFASQCDHESEESEESDKELTIYNLEQAFAEEDKDEGFYKWDSKIYLWCEGELYEESHTKTSKKLLKYFEMNDLFEYENYNWKSIHSKTNNKSSVKKNKAYGCQYCGKEFTSQKGATFHENIHCKEKYEESDDEDEDYTDNDSDNNDYGCRFCDKEFTSQRGATFHENIHCKKKKWNYSNKKKKWNYSNKKKKSNYYS